MLDRGMGPDTVSYIGGIRAISMAAYGGKTDVVRLLLERGANPTYGLPQAVMKNRADIVRLLLAHGADVQHWRDYQASPLQFAQECGNAEIVGLLKAAGAR
jgi:ankyrin repeat protein